MTQQSQPEQEPIPETESWRREMTRQGLKAGRGAPPPSPPFPLTMRQLALGRCLPLASAPRSHADGTMQGAFSCTQGVLGPRSVTTTDSIVVSNSTSSECPDRRWGINAKVAGFSVTPTPHYSQSPPSLVKKKCLGNTFFLDTNKLEASTEGG